MIKIKNREKEVNPPNFGKCKMPPLPKGVLLSLPCVFLQNHVINQWFPLAISLFPLSPTMITHRGVKPRQNLPGLGALPALRREREQRAKNKLQKEQLPALSADPEHRIFIQINAACWKELDLYFTFEFWRGKQWPEHSLTWLNGSVPVLILKSLSKSQIWQGELKHSSII